MRRFWIGVVLLFLILAGAVVLMVLSHHFYKDFSDTLDAAADAALSENWTAAEALAQQATQQWDRFHLFLASFTDHEPIEQVELLLSRLVLFQKTRFAVDFADTCESLSLLGKAIDESHSLKWWSFL